MSDLVAAYLFCAGTGAGAVFLTALFGLLTGAGLVRLPGDATGPRAQADLGRVAVAAYGAALALLILGMLCLLFDLGRPDLALKLFLRPHPTLITFGSYALAALALAAAALLALALAGPPRGAALRRVQAGVQALAALAALGVMAYAGLLLGVTDGAPLLATGWLPVLFVASALASGLAVVMLALAAAGNGRLPSVRYLAGRLTVRADIALIVAEAAAAALCLASAAAAPDGDLAVARLLAGPEAGLFVGGFAALGLAAPLGLDVIQLRGDAPAWAYPLAAAATLFGAACLRMALIHAGSPDLAASVVGMGFAEGWGSVA